VYVHGNGRKVFDRSGMTRFLWLSAILLLTARGVPAQNVLTQHNDIARTGANTSETILTPANVNRTTFGKLFSYTVDGYVYAQPLYMTGVTMGAGTPQAGTKHNVAFIVTEHDSVYALDADGNLGANAKPLWQVTLLDAAHGAAAGAIPMPSSDLNTTDIVPEIGITSTPVIDPASKTIYVVGKTKESGTYVQRLHALDIATGAEKLGGPKVIVAAVPGNGASSSAGALHFDPKWQHQRPGLLLLNGVLYIGFGAHQDFNIWHGWILAYNASTLAQMAAWCSTPNGQLGGVWMAGTGLAAEVPDPTNHPYGRIFVATGNGSYNTASPTFSYGDSVLRLDLANGTPVVGDFFTPHDQSTLDLNDLDQGSAGVLLLPDAVSGGKHLLIQAGKAGAVYVLDRDALGGYQPGTTPDTEQKATVGGMWSVPAYWNGHLYFWGKNDSLKAFSIGNGVLSANPTSKGAEFSSFPGSTPAVSANGTSNGVVWNIRTDAAEAQGRAILYAHDANNVATLLYSSEQNAPRDNPGNAVKFTVPTVIGGKVYVGAEYQVSVYGLLNGLTQAAVPVLNPGTENFNPSVQVTITDSSPGAQIFYTTDGSAPTTASNVYTGPITVTSTQTIQAIAGGSGYLTSIAAKATYTLLTQVATPTFTPSAGEYSATQVVTIKTTSGAAIYYTLDGSTPTTSSTKYIGPISIGATTTLKAFGTLPNVTDSAVASGLYTIDQNGATSINFGSGFSTGGMIMAGAAKLNGSALELTNGGTFEAAAAWFTAEANISAFTNDFNFQITPGTVPTADGFTFTLQASSASAIGPYGGGLGYGTSSTTGPSGIPKSVAIKFDLFSNAGEGANSTGLYANGASPTVPAVTLSNINLHSTDVFHVHMVYDGTNLVMTITDTATNVAFTHTWPIDIPTTLGGPIAYVGFTGGTGGGTAIQDILNWTFSANSTGQPPTATPVITPASGSYTSPQSVTITDSTTNPTIYYTLDGSQPSTSSAQYSGPFTVSSTTTIHAIATAPNFSPSATATSVITIGQPAAATPVISPSSGSYSSPQTVTIIDSTAGSTIYYTQNGSQPTTASPQYTGPFTLSTSATINAIATAPNFSTSNTATSFITIQNGGATAINFASGFSGSGMQFNGHSRLNGTRLQLTDTATTFEVASSYWNTLVNVQAFTTDFDVQLTTPSGDGFTFTMQGSALTAMGPLGGGLGYGPSATTGAPGIPKSVAVKFDLYSNAGEGTNSTGLYTNGASPTVPAITLGGGVSLHSGDIFHVHITYDGATLSMTITDTVTNATFTTSWPINIPNTVGGNTAYVGFTAGTGGSVATQEILDWTYVPNNSGPPAAATPVITPSSGTFSSPQTVSITDGTSGATIYYTLDGSQPTTASTPYTGTFTVNTTTTVKAIATAPNFSSSATATSAIVIQSGATAINFGSGFTQTGMQFNGHSRLNGTRLQLTDTATTFEVASSYWNTLVNVQAFTTDFDVQLTTPSGDGFTFTMQGSALTAMGPLGGGLGYGPSATTGAPGIPKSVAVKFDLYSNAGEGTNSTGMYTNGVSPTVPAITLGGGVSLHSGDIFHVHMTYDGATLSMTITDTTNTAGTFTAAWPINIPATVGANTAYVGFTAGTGGLTATQEILAWTYSN
jgi:hypothetical protein